MVTLTPKTFALKQTNQSKRLLGALGFADTPFQDDSSVAAAHIVSDLGSILAIVHQQQVNLSDIVNQEFLQPVREKVPCLRFGVRFAFG